jgi:hypothetical protein
MLANTMLHIDSTDAPAVLHRPRSRDRDLIVSRHDPMCIACTLNGPLARGQGQTIDRADQRT